MTNYVEAYEGKGYEFRIDEARRLAERLRTEATIIAGVIRWNTNNTVLPLDCVALAAHIGLPIDQEACTAARDTETAAFLAEYRKRSHRVTAEQRAEIRAAFGRDTTVVNVVTGRRIRL